MTLNENREHPGLQGDSQTIATTFAAMRMSVAPMMDR